jgi:4-hydroxybenzoate polyprenyltransferase
MIRVVLKWIRAPELLLLGGPTWVAYVVLAHPVPLELPKLALLAFCLLCGGGHIMIFNALWGARVYPLDTSLMDFPLTSSEWSPELMSKLGVALIVLSIGGLALFSIATGLTAALVALLWTLYGHPRTCLKGKAGWDTAVHAVTGFLHPLMGFLAAGAPLNAFSVRWCGFFCLALVTGHFHHVVKDANIDRAAGLRTVALKIGIRSSVLAGTAGFVITYLLLLFNLVLDLPSASLLLPAVLIVFHVTVLVLLRRRLLSGDVRTLVAYRSMYRTVFVIIGIWLAAVVLIGGVRMPGVH